MNNKFFLALLVFIIIINGINAAETNKSLQASTCLNESYKVVKQLADDNFSVQRVNDTFKMAKELYDFQKIKANPDFTGVFTKCDEIAKIKELAYTSRDQLYGIEKSYSTFQLKMEKINANITEVAVYYNTIHQEFLDERYENVLKGIPELEKDMIEQEAKETTMNLFYKSISRNLKTILIENYITILVILVVLILGFLLYRTKIRIFLIKRKIAKLENEKFAVKELIKKTQKDYFEGGNIAENDYSIKTKRYAEIIRDIDRQIPLLNEQLVEMNSKNPVIATKSQNKVLSKEAKESLPKKTKPVKLKKEPKKWKKASKH
jgi:hypothetical protein